MLDSERGRAKCDVILESYEGGRRSDTARVLQDVTGIEEPEARELMEALPATIRQRIPHADATSLQKRIELAGGVATVQWNQDDFYSLLQGEDEALPAQESRLNRAQAIRSYLLRHPGARPRHVVQALEQEGIEVTASYVSQIAYLDRHKHRSEDSRQASKRTSAGTASATDQTLTLLQQPLSCRVSLPADAQVGQPAPVAARPTLQITLQLSVQ